jgi:hypothetical protein
MHEGYRHVIAVTHIGDVQPPGRAKFFLDGQGVCHALTGMVVIAQTIDNRHFGPPRQFEHVLVRKDARHQRLYIAGKDPGDVRDRFALAETDLIWGEIQSVAAHMPHGHVERDPGAQAGLLEDHGQDPALEQWRISFFEVFLF